MTELVSSGYKGRARELLEQGGATVGSLVKVKGVDGAETSGLVVPRYEHADPEHVVLKLKSGYNIGISVENIQSISVVEKSPTVSTFGQVSAILQQAHGRPKGKTSDKKLLLISTGGTIASRVDYRTGAVHPALSAEDLYSAVPELGDLAEILPEVVFSVYSENLTPSDWQTLSNSILAKSRELEQKKKGRADGVVVMLGTDTLAYVSAALSFSLNGFDLPVVCVGAQRSSDRPSSDAALNLKAAARFAVSSGTEGVFVAMHESENDDVIAIHSGVRVRKNHTSRRDAFESIDVSYEAHVIGNEIKMRAQDVIPVGDSSTKSEADLAERFRLKTSFNPSVALIKFHPGFDPMVLDYYTRRDKPVKGFVIEGTGLGHVSSATVREIGRLSKEGVFIGITSQCIWGHVHLDVYETGRDLIEAGAVPLENMLAETAFAKLSWALGNFEPEQVKEVMLTDIAGEFTQRIALVGRRNS